MNIRTWVVLCAAIVGAGGQMSAADVVVSKFNSADDVSKFRFDFGSVPHTESFDPTVDADSNSKSGSMKISLDFDINKYAGDNKAAYTYDFFPAVDATKYSGFAMDIMVDPNSAVDNFGQNGYFNAAIRNGPNYDYQSQTGINLNSAAGWQHYEVTPLSGTIDAMRGLTLQLYGGPQQNLTGNVTLWIDNIVFEQAQSQIPGDANGDGKVDFADLLILAQNYGKTSGAMFSTGDFNNDGGVGFDDLLILAQNYGFGTGTQAAAVPEPSSGAVLFLSAAVGLRRRRRAARR